MNFEYIDSENSLKRICAILSNCPFIALDTEFIRERTYFPKLALIQVAYQETVACIDPLAIKDLDPLLGILFNPGILKVLHAATQDMELFYHDFHQLPTPVYDTQLAASVLGKGDQISYANLISDMLDIELDKSQTRTNWLIRPLSKKQLQYAADDVRYLAQIYPLQKKQLEHAGRLEWLENDFNELCLASNYQPDPDNAWRRLKGTQKLTAKQLAVLRELASWREIQAITNDRPRRRIIADDVLIELARTQPENASELTLIRGIGSTYIEKNTDAIIQCINNAHHKPSSEWPRPAKKHSLSQEESALTDSLMAILRLCAEQNSVSPSTICNRKELERLAQGERDLPVLNGWRKQHAGTVLLDFLEGRLQLSVSDGHLIMPGNQD